MSIIDFAINKTRAIMVALALIFIAGTYAYIDIPKESDPDINIPIIYVSMSQVGISPEDAERLLIRPMEQELSSIENVKEMTATGFLGGANVVLEFIAGFDADLALQDVREAVDKAKSELPDDANEPRVSEVNFSLFPILVVTLYGEVPERSLLKIARDLQDRVETIPEVLEANIGGDRDELVEIIVDKERIESYGLSADELIPAFSRSNRLVAAGNLDTGYGRFSIKVPGLFETVEDIRSMPVRVDGDSVITLRDIAEIRKTFRDRESYARLNGAPALALEIVKRSGENIIDTIEKVKAVVVEEQQYWPENVQVNFSQDRSQDIRQMLSDLQNNVLSAILLVMIVILAALGSRSAFLVGISIPGSFLAGILILYSIGLTVNVVVLFALILSVGLLVDGAIVVTELADRKMMEGLHKREAYALASKRMAWPIIASTATTLAAFLPLLFWPGIVGEFMKYMPITLIAVLLSSLAMALVFMPVLGGFFGKPGAGADPKVMKALAASEEGNVREIRGFTGWYVRILDKALSHAGKILIAALACLILAQVAYGKFGKGVIFFPDIEPESISFLVHARGNFSIDEQDNLVREVENKLLNIVGFDAIYTRTGLEQGQNQNIGADVIGMIQIDLSDWEIRPTADALIAEVKRRTDTIAGIIVEARKLQGGPQEGKPINLQFSSRQTALLEPAIAHVRRGMEENIVGLVDVEDTRPLPGIEWEMTIDRAQAAKFGADISSAGNAVRLVTNGLEAAEYRPDDSDEEVDIVIRYPEEQRSLDTLDEIKIETPAGSVPLSNFTDRQAQQKITQIDRADQIRIMTIRADVASGENVAQKISEIQSWLETNPVNPAVKITFKGENEDQQESQEFLMRAFAIALFLMALILVTQFNSFYSALLILSAVIMSTIGVMLGLLITGQAFGVVMSGVGVIALAGIVVNNNIVLIDTYDSIKHRTSSDDKEAILRTGAQRLRPVFLTTVTTVLGLLPMVLQINIDFITRTVSIGAPSTQWWVSLSTAIVFGLIFATFLTLIVTPCALMWRVHASRKIQSLFNKNQDA